MKAHDLEEDCVEQINRLFSDFLFSGKKILVDDEKFYQILYASCLINKGYYYRITGNIDSALSYYDKSYKVYFNEGGALIISQES